MVSPCSSRSASPDREMEEALAWADFAHTGVDPTPLVKTIIHENREDLIGHAHRIAAERLKQRDVRKAIVENMTKVLEEIDVSSAVNPAISNLIGTVSELESIQQGLSQRLKDEKAYRAELVAAQENLQERCDQLKEKLKTTAPTFTFRDRVIDVGRIMSKNKAGISYDNTNRTRLY